VPTSSVWPPVDRSTTTAAAESRFSETVVTRGGCLALEVHLSTGELLRLSRSSTDASGLVTNISSNFTHEFWSYDNTTSGSYYFSPKTPARRISLGAPEITFRSGPVVVELTQSFLAVGLVRTLTLRMNKADSLCSVLTVSAGNTAPLADAQELVVRAGAAGTIPSQQSLRWDDGMSMVPASFNASWCDDRGGHFQLCGGNYKPAIGSVLLEPSDTTGRGGAHAHEGGATADGDLERSRGHAAANHDAVSLFAAFERTVGAASPAEGTLEVMVQRNVGADGMGPPCNDTSNAILPMHMLLSLHTPADTVRIAATEVQQQLVQQMVSTPLRLFSINQSTKQGLGFFSSFLICRGLPGGITLQALEAWSQEGTSPLLMRTTHQRAGGQTVLFRLLNRRSMALPPVIIQFDELFSGGVRLTDVVETNLLGNELIGKIGADRIRMNQPLLSDERARTLFANETTSAVTLRSKDLRTFVGTMSLQQGS
jgi:hypothetical protein